MFAFNPTFKVTPALKKYIRDSTNKSIEKKLNKSKATFDSTDNVELTCNLSKTLFIYSFFICSFLAGYQYKCLQK